ncbi:orotidine-5'-phosphate decarboxylase [Tahibacter amnicola]|uniref:Orotidine 5'-phosphate decarboxylase n=1 Tax=Tahibacter amnicola TaxID=2976241 RepID=A0ABY6BJN3_9GAMM|nr:orotidine-5'-phosphate decarboxylase [Tahibacter amnicola]UXI68590.1 orotidine-5'-phosphate decarboxylase [Tahibacter amnicola]
MSYSPKSIDPRDRLIFALDVPTRSEALEWVDRLGDAVTFYKIGMELLTSGEYFQVLADLAERGKKIFVDLKFFDVPATVASAVKGLTRYPVTFCTIHGNDGMMRAAAAVKGDIRILAVTALTSLDQHDLDDLGFRCEPEQLVLSRAKAALAAGCDGVVSSGLEVAALRRDVDHALITVCPGIRPVGNVDDQKRTMDVAEAFAAGADYIVVGRPIRQSADPRAAALAMQDAIAAAVARR